MQCSGLPGEGLYKLRSSVRSSHGDWSSFQLAITMHQLSFTHYRIAPSAKIIMDMNSACYLWVAANSCLWDLRVI